MSVVRCCGGADPSTHVSNCTQVGETGDPGLQGQDSYRRYLLNRAERPGTSGIVRETPCPCLLLELLGAELRFSALASTCDIQVICQPLTPRLHLFDMFDEDWQHMVALAKALRAFKYSLEVLRRYYEPAHQATVGGVSPAKRPRLAQPYQSPLDRNPLLSLPYPLRTGFSGGAAGVLPEPVQQRRQLYRCWRSGDVRTRLVKFLPHGSYGEAVHRAWAQHGLAPELYEIKQLAGGFCMVEMEELRREEGWLSVAALPIGERSERLSEAVQDALQRAHGLKVSAGKCGVHGDARAANVLVRRPAVAGCQALGEDQQASVASASAGAGGEIQQSASSQGAAGEVQQQGALAQNIEVRFVDFDWAGLADEAELPLWAVPRKGLPENRKLTRQYDLSVWEETWLLDSY